MKKKIYSHAGDKRTMKSLSTYTFPLLASIDAIKISLQK